MRLAYIANLRLPTEKAYGIQIVQTCQSLADLGVGVVLIAPFRFSRIKDNLFNYYGIRRNFVFKKIFVPDFYFPGILGKAVFILKNFISSLVLSFYSLLKKFDYFYTRDELVAYILSIFKKNILFECHRFSRKKKFFYRKFKNSGLKIVVISRGLKEEFLKLGFKDQDVLIARDGVDFDAFSVEMTKEDARKILNLPQNKKIVMYTGHLFEWKGASTLLQVAKLISNFEFRISNSKEILFVFVGGTDRDIKEFRKKANSLSNVLVLGHKPSKEIPVYLKSADVLVLPNSDKELISKKYTSPLKLFEYMASKRPIVASDLDSVREVLNTTNATFFRPDNSDSLAEAINYVLENSLEVEAKALNAFNNVKEYSWLQRSRNILNFIRTTTD